MNTGAANRVVHDNTAEDIVEWRGEHSVNGHLTSAQTIQQDKEALARLLTSGVSAASIKGQAFDLEQSEELLRLLPVICAYFSQKELARLVGKELAARFLDMYRLETLQNLFLERELQHILHVFNEQHVPFLLFKGPALAYTVYPKASLRTYHDIDLLIRPADLAMARDALASMGYEYYEEFRANAIDSKRAGYNFRLQQSDSWLEVLVELHTAPHPAQGSEFFDPEAIRARARSAVILGEPVLMMDTADHLLYLCWHYRFHGFTRLIWLYDIVVILRAAGPSMDWDALIESAHRLHLATNLYYCLAWCRDLFGVSIPGEVLARLHPPFLCRLFIERIAMPDAAKALSTASWSQRRVLARRAMFDSWPELLFAGVGTFFPSPAVMGRRYMNHSSMPMQFVYVFYLIHPWVTLAKGVHNIVKREKGKQP